MKKLSSVDFLALLLMIIFLLDEFTIKAPHLEEFILSGFILVSFLIKMANRSFLKQMEDFNNEVTQEMKDHHMNDLIPLKERKNIESYEADKKKKSIKDGLDEIELFKWDYKHINKKITIPEIPEGYTYHMPTKNCHAYLKDKDGNMIPLYENEDNDMIGTYENLAIQGEKKKEMIIPPRINHMPRDINIHEHSRDALIYAHSHSLGKRPIIIPGYHDKEGERMFPKHIHEDEEVKIPFIKYKDNHYPKWFGMDFGKGRDISTAFEDLRDSLYEGLNREKADKIKDEHLFLFDGRDETIKKVEEDILNANDHFESLGYGRPFLCSMIDDEFYVYMDPNAQAKIPGSSDEGSRL
jgi:hypothetical protein